MSPLHKGTQKTGGFKMARKAREKSATGMYNVIIKGSVSLFNTDEDYDFFIEIMQDYIDEIYAFAITPSAICIAMKETGKGIGMDLKPLMTKYARYYNKNNNLEGKLFADRFKSEPIESDKELKNSVALIEDLLSLTNSDGYTSVNGDGKYEMIEFYSSLTGKKAVEKKKAQPKKSAVKKSAPATKKSTPAKKATTTAKKTVAPKKTTTPKPVKAVETVKEEAPKKSEEKKRNNSLPTWLL